MRPRARVCVRVCVCVGVCVCVCACVPPSAGSIRRLSTLEYPSSTHLREQVPRDALGEVELGALARLLQVPVSTRRVLYEDTMSAPRVPGALAPLVLL